MKNMGTENILQIIFTGIIAFFTIVTAIGAILAAVYAHQIGIKQNEISEATFKINNFVEIFLMPQQYQLENGSSTSKITKWNILVKNVSSYPVYLNSFTLNGLKTDIGSTPIPNNPESWYGVPIPDDVQNKGEFSLIVNFEDYLGKKYESEGFGKFNGLGWNIHQNKRIEINL